MSEEADSLTAETLAVKWIAVERKYRDDKGQRPPNQKNEHN